MIEIRMTVFFWYNFVMLKYHNHCNSYQPSFQFPMHFYYDDIVDENDISRTVKEVVEEVNIFKFIDFSQVNAHGYDVLKMFEAVILAFSIQGYSSLRNLENLCKYDIRFKFIMEGQTPSHMAFERFIKDKLTMPIEDIFVEINKYIEGKDKIDTDVLYIDGTKIEANANKMTFVWMKATKNFRTKRWIRIMKRLKTFNKYCEKNGYPIRFSILKEFSFEYLIEIVTTIEDLMKKEKIEFVYGKGKRKHILQKYQESFKEDTLKMWKYTIHSDIAGERNSFSKTDPDATFMHMKYDYYNHTNVFKPGYNVQIGNSDGYIRHVYISSDANDLKTYIPFMEGYYMSYGRYPSITPADAGYGSFDNYKYCKNHGIELYMKYSGMRKEAEKRTKKNQFLRAQLQPNENDDIICPAGHKFTLKDTRIERRGEYAREIEMYQNDHCEGCPLRAKCTKSKKGRTLQRCRELESYKNEVKKNLSTEQGKTYMALRSILAEGIFGQIKEDHHYDRLRRRGISGVKTEILLVCIGHNLRKYHTNKIKSKKLNLMN